MLRPGIDEGYVLPRLRHMRAGITADRARSYDRNPCTHFLTPFVVELYRFRNPRPLSHSAPTERRRAGPGGKSGRCMDASSDGMGG